MLGRFAPALDVPAVPGRSSRTFGKKIYTTMKRNLLLILGVLVVGISFYLLGLAQGTNRAVKGSNSSSISTFTAIHRILKEGDIQNAIKMVKCDVLRSGGRSP